MSELLKQAVHQNSSAGLSGSGWVAAVVIVATNTVCVTVNHDVEQQVKGLPGVSKFLLQKSQ